MRKLNLVRYLESKIGKPLNGNNLRGMGLREKYVHVVKPIIQIDYETV